MKNNPTAGITRPFLREERYYVLKISDMRKYLSREKFEFVGAIAEKLNAGRAVDGKTVLQAVVVEHDWPEYERVWNMIETRMSTTRRQFLNCNNDRRFWAIPESGDETEALGRRRWQCKCGTRYWVTLTKCHCPSCGQAAGTAKTETLDQIQHQPQTDWISVSDCMPEPYTEVLVTMRYGAGALQVKTSEYDPDFEENSGWCFGSNYSALVTHWMPMPEVAVISKGKT